jgi:hypothetical protein
MRLHALTIGALLSLSACGSKVEVPQAPPTQAEVEPVATVPAHCLAVGGMLDPTLAAKQSGCPCDANLQRDSCVEGRALTCGPEGTWRLPADGPCGQGIYPSARCKEAIAQGSPSASACACDHDYCNVFRGTAHVCSAGQWVKVAVSDCWRRVKER